MDEALWALLLNATPAGDRVYWGEVAQGVAPPAISMRIIGGADEPHLRGTDGLTEYRVSIDCLGANRTSAQTVARSVITLLNGHSGGGFNAIFLDTQREDRDGQPERAVRAMLDFNVFWRA